jgi:hypothetical protein
MAYHEVAMKVRQKNRGELTIQPTMRLHEIETEE